MSPEKEDDPGSFCSCRARSRTQTFHFQCRLCPVTTQKGPGVRGVGAWSRLATLQVAPPSTMNCGFLVAHLRSLNPGPLA